MITFNDILIKWGIVKDPKEISFHPSHKEGAIEYAFSIENKHFYNFKTALDIPILRLRMMKKFYSEMQMCIDEETLVKFCDKIMEHCNNGKLLDAGRVADELKYRSSNAFEYSTLYRLASCTYFTLDENVEEYDFAFNEWKIELFKKKDETLKFFLRTLLKNSSSLLGLSDYDFQSYLNKLTKMLETQQKLISDPTPKDK